MYLPEKGSVVLGGRDITRLPEHKRAKYLGRVFQDPMMGTAASMEIQENMALANRRGKIRGLGWGVGKKEKAFFKQKLEFLGAGSAGEWAKRKRLSSNKSWSSWGLGLKTA